MTLWKHLKNIGNEVKEAFEEGKETVYDAASTVEEQIKERKGFFGKATNVVEKGIDSVKGIHELVQGKGGYKSMATDVKDSITGKVETAYKSVETAYKAVENKFYTDGEYDSGKTKDFLKNQGEASLVLGKKAVSKLVELANKGTKLVVNDYRKLVPTADEIMTKYAGIGTQHKGMLFREHYDSCLDFHDKAKSKIPNALGIRNEILNDIKASASGKLAEMHNFYMEQETPEAQEKLNILKQYF
ncbi:MAG: hypothetical protein ABIB43_03335 [archaeon]